ncbi:hypothetical protein A2U01_0057810, partial [Trifolium medium]|nr:hypothetical protein [Trifolium medium]
MLLRVLGNLLAGLRLGEDEG